MKLRSETSRYRKRQINLSILIASVWAFAEATLFFIIPDVFLTWVALSSLRLALRCCVAAAVVAIAGGLLMYVWGGQHYQLVSQIMTYIPGISTNLIHQVAQSVQQSPYSHLFLAPIRGIPYKLYAIEFGHHQLPILGFITVSFVARLLRFVITTLIAGGVAFVLRKHLDLKYLQYMHIATWLIIYILYFVWI